MDNIQKVTWDTAQKKELDFFMNSVELETYRNLWKAYINSHKNLLTYFSRETTALDVCCGPLSILDSLSQVKNKIAIDSQSNKYLTKFAKSSQVVYITSKAEELPFKDNSFDVVLCINALDHTEDWSKVVKEIWRVLKSRGKFYLDFEQTSYLELFLMKLGWKKHLSEHHLANLSLNAVAKRIKDRSKYCIIKVKYEPFLNIRKIILGLNFVFSKTKLNNRPEWEKRISSLNISFSKKIIYYFIHFYNFIGYVFYRRAHTYFVKVLLEKYN